MKTPITFLDFDFEVECEIRITSRGCPETGPTYSCGGQPAEPPEYEITVTGLLANKTRLELPDWLKELLETYLYETDAFGDAVIEQLHEEKYGDL